jgi:hypothetical protein
MAPVLLQAQRELEGQLRMWLLRENGEARFTTQRYRNALLAVRRAAGALRALDHNTAAALWTGAEGAGRLATAHLEKELLQFGAIFEGTIQPVSIDAAAVIARGEDLLVDRFDASSRLYAGSVRTTVVQELAVSRVKGETIFELTARLDRRLPHVFMGQRNAAERLARTETMQAYNVVHHQGLLEISKDDPDIIARWDGSFDGRRCPACGSLDGETKDVAKGEVFTAKWVAGRKGHRHLTTRSVEHPPLHPNCRCVLTPWRADWPDFARPRAPAAEGTRIGA